MTSRRTFITGLASIVAAPVIVRASSLMPVKAWLGDGISSIRHPSEWSNTLIRRWHVSDLGLYADLRQWRLQPPQWHIEPRRIFG